MLFNSYQFIGFFLPVVLLFYFLAGRYESTRLGILAIASIAFYGYWDWRFLPLLLASITFNWVLSQQFHRINSGLLIYLGASFNLCLIAVFKYLDFFGQAFYSLGGADYSAMNIVLPLGISFFTFQQISYIVDRGRNAAPEYSLLNYTLYVTFFPQLIAGPIVRHNEIIPQYQKSPYRPDIYRHLGLGVALFAIGLLKKTLIADRLANTASPLFDLAATGELLSFGESWSAAISYSLQLYFDFSGYSDMAIGLGLMFGLTLPVNFNAPYRAMDIQDFWRRWHMTLSRFLKDYLYIPLGGSRYGASRTMSTLFITMLLGGLWHGAGWTYVIWGALHGGALIVHRAWSSTGIRLPRYIAWPLLIVFLLVTWIVFRADSFQTSLNIWESMVGLHGLDLEVRDAPTRWFSLFAFALAILGPTSQVFVCDKFLPKPTVAIATAVLVFYLILNVANDGYSEFLYFQF